MGFQGTRYGSLCAWARARGLRPEDNGVAFKFMVICLLENTEWLQREDWEQTTPRGMQAVWARVFRGQMRSQGL